MESQGGVRVVAEALDLVDSLQVELAEAADQRRQLALTTTAEGPEMSSETARIVGRVAK